MIESNPFTSCLCSFLYCFFAFRSIRFFTEGHFAGYYLLFPHTFNFQSTEFLQYVPEPVCGLNKRLFPGIFHIPLFKRPNLINQASIDQEQLLSGMSALLAEFERDISQGHSLLISEAKNG